jgi:hypothetical protein
VNPDRLGERRAAALSEQERELYRWVLNRLAAGSTATGHELEAASRDLECLQWALASGQDSGVWGGTSEEERRAMRRAVRPEQVAVIG